MLTGLSSLSSRNLGHRESNSVGFSGEKSEFNNPVNPTTEKALACVGPSILSIILGGAAYFAAHNLVEIAGKKLSHVKSLWIGAGVAALSALMTIPGAIYNANVRASMRKEQYNPFEAEKKAETALQRQLLKQARKDPDDLKALSEKANIAMTLGIAKQGNGIAFISPNSQ